MPIARLLIIYSMDVLSYTTYHGQKLENYDLESLSNEGSEATVIFDNSTSETT